MLGCGHQQHCHAAAGAVALREMVGWRQEAVRLQAGVYQRAWAWECERYVCSTTRVSIYEQALVGLPINLAISMQCDSESCATCARAPTVTAILEKGGDFRYSYTSGRKRYSASAASACREGAGACVT